MTCIVGVVENGKVWIGGDSAGVGGHISTLRADPKVFRRGDFVMGFTTSFRMGQLLAHVFEPPELRSGQDVYAYMVRDFVPALRQCFSDGGYAGRSSEGRDQGGAFLVAICGRLFCVEPDYQVGESLNGYDACGSGAQLALGALHAGRALKPEARIVAALEAAQHFNITVRAPFIVLCADAAKTECAA